MLTQIFLDTITGIFVLAVGLIPPLPTDLATTVAQLHDGAGDLGAAITRFGIVVPFGTATAILATWASLVGFWFASLVVRLILWVFGR